MMTRQEFDPLGDLAVSAATKAAVRDHLVRLAGQQGHPALRAMARDVLAGKVNLRGALADPKVTEVLDAQVARFSGWYRELSDEERAEQARRGEEHAEQVRREAAAAQQPSRPPGRRPPPDPADDDVTDRPILRRRNR